MNKYTSFELSKKLWENGCRNKFTFHTSSFNQIKSMSNSMQEYPSYDILWDICIKYSKEFFGKKSNDLSFMNLIFNQVISNANYEDTIWDNCLFNSKNKGK